jgi:hypothetical protein
MSGAFETPALMTRMSSRPWRSATLHQAGNVVGLCQIRHLGFRKRSDIANRGVQAGDIASDRDDARSGAGERRGRRAADAAAGPGDEGDPSSNLGRLVWIHGAISFINDC